MTEDLAVVPLNMTVWTRAIRGRVSAKHMGVALALASYVEEYGPGYSPGVEQLVADLKCGRGIILRSLQWLGENGWISGGESGARVSDVNLTYRLTIPFDVAEALGFVGPACESSS